MIEEIGFGNFKSFGPDASLRFEGQRLLVLVGQNGAGKSNALQALQFISKKTLNTNDDNSVYNSGKDEMFFLVKTNSIKWKFTLAKNKDISSVKNEVLSVDLTDSGEKFEDIIFDADEKIIYNLHSRHGIIGVKLDMFSNGNDNVSLRISHFVNVLMSINVFSPSVSALRQLNKKTESKKLTQTGSNWINILDSFSDKEKANLVVALRNLTGFICDFKVENIGRYKSLSFSHLTDNKMSEWIDFDQESDGTLRVAALLTALLQPDPLDLIGIEEPELSVHPGMLPLLMDYIKEASDRSQIVLTTHSPYLLDLVPPEAIRVVERVNGYSTIRSLANDQVELIKKKLLSASELQYMEGLRGEPVPSTEQTEETPAEEGGHD